MSIISGGAFGFAASAIWRGGYRSGYAKRVAEETEYRLSRLESLRADDEPPAP